MTPMDGAVVWVALVAFVLGSLGLGHVFGMIGAWVRDHVRRPQAPWWKADTIAAQRKAAFGPTPVTWIESRRARMRRRLRVVTRQPDPTASGGPRAA